MQAFLISLGARVRPAGLAIGLTIFACALSTVCLLAAAPAEVDVSKLPAPSTRQMDFARDIAPILAEHCHTCHGAKKQESGLRLDQKETARKGGESYGKDIIVPGKSAESVLIQAVAQIHPELKMPKKGERLTAEQVGMLRAWIDQGAVWPQSTIAQAKDPKAHWAFKPPVKPSTPAVKTKGWVRTPIDPFVLARLEKEHLQPTPEADRVTLLRRVSLDLIGLPPTIEEVDAFVADKSSDAYSKQVERLLKSPHYGERWGRYWLDAARYADSDGYEKDMSRQAFFYRDYVLGAFNRDLPYNQFLIEQLAGDQLPHPTQDQIVATGFLRNSMLNQEGAIDPEQFRMDSMFDRMDAIGKAMLGLTVQCAQCHNHKYDPFTQEDYYRIFAFLNNDHEARPAVYTRDEQAKVDSLQHGIAEIEAGLKRGRPDWEKQMAAWEDAARLDQPEWQVVWPLFQVGEKSQRYYELKDQSLLAAGYAPTKMTESFRNTNQLAGIRAFRIELLTDPNLPYGGPGRSFMGTCALTEFAVDVLELQHPTNKVKVKWSSATTDYDQPEHPLESNFDDKSTNRRVTGPLTYAFDNNDLTAWGIDAGAGRRNTDRKAVFVADQPVGFADGSVFTFHLKQNHGGWNSDDHMNNNLGRFRLSVSTASNAVADPLPRRVRDLITNVPRAQRTPAQTAEIFSFWRTTVADWHEANARIEKLRDGWPSAATALTLMSRGEMRDTHVLKRGDWLKPTDSVAPGVPSFLNPLPKGAAPTRLTFAKWIADRKAPTPARVFVNRIWQAYFGSGIVGTPEDFGTQCDSPTHPELLDWLACEFMDHGWSVKAVHRLIVNSATYRQGSQVTPALYERDPYNRLLARGPRFRVEGEVVRDIALAASGLLNPEVGGRSVMPPAPAFLFQPPASYAPFPWKDEADSQKYRRALYTFRRRSTPYPVLQTFDVPNADMSCVRRLRSNSPLQALVSLNESIFVECAQALARRTLAEGGRTDPDRITYAFRRALARNPTADERQELLALLDKERARMAEGWLNPNEIATGDNKPPANLPAGATPTQLAAYTVVSRVLLNLDETITKE